MFLVGIEPENQSHLGSCFVRAVIEVSFGLCPKVLQIGICTKLQLPEMRHLRSQSRQNKGRRNPEDSRGIPIAEDSGYRFSASLYCD